MWIKGYLFALDPSLCHHIQCLYCHIQYLYVKHLMSLCSLYDTFGLNGNQLGWKFFFFLFFSFFFFIPLFLMCSPSWTLLPPPSPYHPSGSSQCTSPKHPASCIEPGLIHSYWQVKGRRVHYGPFLKHHQNHHVEVPITTADGHGRVSQNMAFISSEIQTW